MLKKSPIIAFLVLVFVLLLRPPTFSPKIAYSQSATANETQVACGEIIEGEFINNAEDHIYLLPMQPRGSFDVTLEPAGDDLKTLVAIYGPSEIRLKISGDYFESMGYGIPRINQVSSTPKLVSGTLSARGLYKIRVTNTAVVVAGHQDMVNDKLYTDNNFLGGVGAYRLFIGCTNADQSRIEPGDTAQPTPTPAPTPTEQVGAQTTIAPEPFLEVGKTYEIAFGLQTEIIKVVELSSDGWTKIEVDSRVGWLNINQVALIIPLD